MKKHIREILDELRKRNKPQSPLPGDLENQELSNDPLERARQLDFQAQQSEERQSS